MPDLIMLRGLPAAGKSSWAMLAGVLWRLLEY